MVKITRPSLHGIHRCERLFMQIEKARARPVIWISAPAGSGKTTLVSSYLESRGLPCLWFQFDQGDADPATFFYYLGLAAKKAAPRQRKPLPLLTSEYSLGVPAFTARFFEKCYSRLKRPAILVFDDYHEVPLAAPLHEIMANGLDLVPPGLNVLILSRNDPPEACVRLKARQQLAFLGWETLRLNDEESRGIIAIKSPDVSADTVAHLQTLADGWAAGLILMLEALKSRTTTMPDLQDRTRAEFFGYFAQEVFRKLDAKTRDLLLQTSFLPKMTVAMAQVQLRDLGAGKILQDLSRNNYFTNEYFDREPFYAYHPLFREFLQARVRETFAAGDFKRLLRQSAEILEQADQPEAAVELLKSAGDYEGLVAVILSRAQTMLAQGRHRSLESWLRNLPQELLNHDPRLLYWKGMSTLFFDALESRRCFERSFEHFQENKDAPGALLAAAGVCNAIAFGLDDYTAFDEWFPKIKSLAHALQPLGNAETEAWVATGFIVALAMREIPDPEADQWAERVLHLAETPTTLIPKINALYYLYFYYSQNKGIQGLEAVRFELRRLAHQHPDLPLALIMTHMADAGYYAGMGMHAECEQSVRQGLDLSENHGILFLVFGFHFMLMGSLLNGKRVPEAGQILHSVLPAVEKMPANPRCGYIGYAAREALISGDNERALEQTRQGLAVAERLGWPLLIGQILGLQALALRRLGEKREARRVLERAFENAVRAKNKWVLMFVYLYRAYFAFDEQDDENGCKALRDSLGLARELGYFYCIFDDPKITLQICLKALEYGIEIGQVREIIRRRGLVAEETAWGIEDWPWPVKIRTLGKFVLFRDDKPLTFSFKAQKKPLTLLKVLISQGGQAVHEDRLADLLWPEADGDLAHQSFRTTLHRLRKLLGHPEALLFQEGYLSLNERICWVDVRAFEQWIAEAEVAGPAAQARPDPGLMQKARSLYCGAFLAGEREEPWMVSMREKLRNRYLHAIGRVAAAYEQMNKWEQAAGCYEESLHIDDCVEEIYLRLMRCYQNLGRSDQVLAVYDRCRRTFADLYGVKPSAAIEAVRNALHPDAGQRKS